MTDQLPTITRHTFKSDGNGPGCAWVEPGPGRHCREPKNHEVHTPRGSTRRSWLESKLSAAGTHTSAAGWAILSLTEQATRDRADREAAMSVVVEALHELVDETGRWRSNWAAEHVNRDREVREAMARSESCEHHGEEIRQLSEQVAHFDEAHQQADKGRVALLGLLFELDRFIAGWDGLSRAGKDVPDTGAVVEALRRLTKAARRDHDRAWKR